MRKIGVLVLLIVLSSMLWVTVNGTGKISLYTFDKDGDRIDDRVDLNGDFPIYGLVHVDRDSYEGDPARSISSLGCSVGTSLVNVPVIIVQFPSREALVSVSKLQYVEVIESDQAVRFAMDTSVKAVKVGSSNEYSPDTVRDLGFTGEGMTVAVLDLGIDNDHPLLEGSFVAGVDFTVPDSPLTPRDGSYDPDDLVGHGTGVACVLASRGNEEGKYKGIAPDVGIIDLKMSDYNPAYIRAMAEAMDWCIENQDTDWGGGNVGIDVISMSALTGLDPDGTISNLIDQIAENGIPFVQAAGNDGVQHGEDPARYFWSDNVITVGGLDDRGTVNRDDDIYWSGATYGPRVDDGDDDPYDELRPDVVAPAVNLTVGANSADTDPPSGMTQVEGTSYATPHVSGVVVLILQANPQIARSTGTDVLEQIRAILHSTAEARGEPYDLSLSSKYNTMYGYGILDGYKAVQRAIALKEGNSYPKPDSFEIDPQVVSPGGQSMIYLEASDPDGDPLRYEIEVEDGTIEGTGPTWAWTAPVEEGRYGISITMTDPFGSSSIITGDIEVQDDGESNSDPVINSFTSSSETVFVGGSVDLEVDASDPDGDPLDYEYGAGSGRFFGSGDEVEYEAPDEPGDVTITVIVTDGRGGRESSSLSILVMDVPPSRPPVIRSFTLTPVSINEGNPSVKLNLEIEVIEGSYVLEDVYADLSDLKRDPRSRCVYQETTVVDGVNVLHYSLELRSLQILKPGTYSISVFAEDNNGLVSDEEVSSFEVKEALEEEDAVVDQEGRNEFPIWAVVIIFIIIIFALLLALIIRKVGS